jgi:hypothetical protein
MLPNKKQPRKRTEGKKEMENKKIMVNVYQTKENDKKELVNKWNDEKTNLLQLTAFLYRKAILKSNNLKIKHSYNYSDLQTITFIDSYENCDGSITKTFYEFVNVPTNMAYLDIYKIEKNLESEDQQ